MRHTLTGNVVCGGVYPGTDTSCLELAEDGSGWVPYSSLTTRRLAHSSWASPQGIVLMGGYYSGDTTELVTSNGSVSQFTLNNNVRLES